MANHPIDCYLLGFVLRRLREKQGFSQEVLAARAGLHRTYIGGVERGERNPSFESIARILKGLGASWTVLGRALDRQSEALSDE